MKTSLTRKKERRGPHHRYEDLPDEEKREERSSSPIYRYNLTWDVVLGRINYFVWFSWTLKIDYL